MIWGLQNDWLKQRLVVEECGKKHSNSLLLSSMFKPYFGLVFLQNSGESVFDESSASGPFPGMMT